MSFEQAWRAREEARFRQFAVTLVEEHRKASDAIFTDPTPVTSQQTVIEAVDTGGDVWRVTISNATTGAAISNLGLVLEPRIARARALHWVKRGQDVFAMRVDQTHLKDWWSRAMSAAVPVAVDRTWGT